MPSIPPSISSLSLFGGLPALASVVQDHNGQIPLPISAEVHVEVHRLAAQAQLDPGIPVETQAAMIVLKTEVDFAARNSGGYGNYGGYGHDPAALQSAFKELAAAINSLNSNVVAELAAGFAGLNARLDAIHARLELVHAPTGHDLGVPRVAGREGQQLLLGGSDDETQVSGPPTNTNTTNL